MIYVIIYYLHIFSTVYFYTVVSFQRSTFNIAVCVLMGDGVQYYKT